MLSAAAAKVTAPGGAPVIVATRLRDTDATGMVLLLADSADDGRPAVLASVSGEAKVSTTSYQNQGADFHQGDDVMRRGSVSTARDSHCCRPCLCPDEPEGALGERMEALKAQQRTSRSRTRRLAGPLSLLRPRPPVASGNWTPVSGSGGQ